jgi:hypothetical protein
MRLESCSQALEFLVKMPWSDHFDEPIPAKGRTLVTLECAAKYIRKLSNAEQESQHWQSAIEALIMAAENSGPTTMARIGIMRALNRNAGVEPKRRTGVQPQSERRALGPYQAGERPMKTVWIYGKADTLIEFASDEDAPAWLKANDPDGNAIECQLEEWRAAGTADRYGVPRATTAGW